MASTSPANGPNPTIPVLLTDLDSAVQAEKQIEITRDAGPLACFLTATNDKPRRINLNGANWQVDLKGKKIPVQVAPKGYRTTTKTRLAMDDAFAIVKLAHNPQLVQLYRLGNRHLRYRARAAWIGGCCRTKALWKVRCDYQQCAARTNRLPKPPRDTNVDAFDRIL
jgi:hypothetical protein